MRAAAPNDHCYLLYTGSKRYFHFLQMNECSASIWRKVCARLPPESNLSKSFWALLTYTEGKLLLWLNYCCVARNSGEILYYAMTAHAGMINFKLCVNYVHAVKMKSSIGGVIEYPRDNLGKYRALVHMKFQKSNLISVLHEGNDETSFKWKLLETSA